TLLHEAAHAALAVLGGEQAREPVPFDGEAGVDVRLQAGVDGLLGRAQRQRRTLRQLRGPGVRLLVDLGGGHHPVHQAERQRLVGPDLTAGEDEVLRAGRADEAGKALGRSEEHTSELQSRENLVCRLLLEKKKPDNNPATEFWLVISTSVVATLVKPMIL